MPCYRCGTRQVDPVRGHSPWQRGVRADEQVLICPGCQAGTEWKSELDRCQRCGSIRLVRRLGEVECRECGLVVPPEVPAGGDVVSVGASGPAVAGSEARWPGTPGARAGEGAAAPLSAAPAAPAALGSGGRAPGLAEEVALALDRVLGRPGKPSAPAGRAR